MGYISLPSNLNGIIGITSYCVILKLMILYDAIKTIKNKVFPFSLKKENLVSFQKIQKSPFFFKPGGFFSTLLGCRPPWGKSTYIPKKQFIYINKSIALSTVFIRLLAALDCKPHRIV